MTHKPLSRIGKTGRVTEERRKVIETAHFKNVTRSLDPLSGLYVVQVHAGGCHISTGGEVLATVLGSCVSACIRDPALGIGGMNRFLLPGSFGSSDEERINSAFSLRYGIFAMQTLINGILQAGGVLARLEIKIFGGGNIVGHAPRAGSLNAIFLSEFLRERQLSPCIEDLEGALPRRLRYSPDTGQVLLEYLHRNEDLRVMRDEQDYDNALLRELPV